MTRSNHQGNKNLMEKPSLQEALREIIKKDPRFMPDAYIFLQEALTFTVKYMSKPHRGPGQHVRGAELLDGIRRYALQEYGAMSKTVLNTWGLTRCEDFGDIVFHLVNKGILRKTEEDKIEDFSGAYEFEAAFRAPFRPRKPYDEIKASRKMPLPEHLPDSDPTA